MSEQETYHRCLSCNEIIENRTLKRCWDCYFKCYPVAIGTMDDFVSANPDRKRKRNKMSEQEKAEVKEQFSGYGKLRNLDAESTVSQSQIVQELDLVNKLLARAEKAEAALESAQKMSDHWEVKAKDWKFQAERNHEAWCNREKLVWNANVALNAAEAETHHPSDSNGKREPMTFAERIEWLAKSRDEWKHRAGNAEFELNRQKDLMNPIDWNRVRIDAAIAAMQGMLADTAYDPGREMAATAVAYADDLVFETQGSRTGMKEPLWKRVGRFVVCMASLGPTLLFCLIALEIEKRRLKREEAAR